MMGAWSSAIPGCIGQDDIGREIWVWDERETLNSKNIPPRSGGESHSREDPPIGIIRDDHGMIVIVVVVVVILLGPL